MANVIDTKINPFRHLYVAQSFPSTSLRSGRTGEDTPCILSVRRQAPEVEGSGQALTIFTAFLRHS